MKVPVLLFAVYFSCLWGSLTAQSEGTDQLADLTFVETTMNLALTAYNSGNFTEALEKANDVEVIARQLGETEWQAQALQLEAMAMAGMGDRPGQIARVFRESIQLTSDPDLKLANLNELRKIAIQLRQGEELQQIAREIASLTATNEDAGRPRRPKAALREVTAENEELNEQLQELETEQEELMEAVQLQEELIQGMNEEQAKVELLLAQQRILVDSLSLVKMQDSLQLVQQEMLISSRDMKLREQTAKLSLQRTRLTLISVMALMLLIGGFSLYSRQRGIQRHAKELEKLNGQLSQEKERSESLLLNILPAKVAEELKEQGKANARLFKNATVLFTDFRNFTKIAEGMAPEALVEDLDFCFRAFDKIMDQYNLEKIKTIGDAYMCVGGIPETDPEHPTKIVQAALDIQTFLSSWQQERKASGNSCFEARIGIHTGPLVAGVVGSKKFAYDVWGNTVNLASRMESSGEAGKVNISEATYQQVKDAFPCTYRGKIKAKNAGEMGMYFVGS